MARRLALLVSLLTALPALAVPGDRPWTSDDVLGLKVVTDPQVSPDGRLVAYVVESLNGEKDAYQTDVWLVPDRRRRGARPRLVARGRRHAPLVARRPLGGLPLRAAAAGRQGGRRGRGEAPGLADPAGRRRGGAAHRGPGLRLGLRVVGGREDDRLHRPRAEERRAEAAREGEGRRLDALRGLRLESPLVDRRRHAAAPPAHDRRRCTSPASASPRTAGPWPSPASRRRSSRTASAPTSTPSRPRAACPPPLVARKGTDNAPAWSPDGKWIAFVSQDGRDEEWYTNTCVERRPRRGRSAAHAHRVPRRADRRPRRLGPHLDARQHGRPLPRR